MKRYRKLVLAALFVALGVACSPFYIPFGFAKCFPVQHLLNVLSAVLLGPAYALAVAFSVSFLRLMMGLGSLLAFPGSMVGALSAALFYRYAQNEGRRHPLRWALGGEVFGTGILGSFLAWPIAKVFMSKNVAFYAYILPFLLSTAVGAVFAYFLLKALLRSQLPQQFLLSEEASQEKGRSHVG